MRNPRKSLKPSWIFFLLMLLPYSIAGEASFPTEPAPSAVPETPDLVLPPMILEVEGREEVFSVPLPVVSEPKLELPPLLLTPNTGVSLPPAFLDVPLGSQPAEGLRKEKPSLYTEGTFGIGTMNSLVGALSLFQRGEDHKLNLHFSHEGADGYQFKEAGKGFFDRRDTMEGSGTIFLSEKSILNLEGSIEERELGLQEVSASYSNQYRFIDTATDFSYDIMDSLKLNTRLGILFADRLRTGSDPRSESEFGGSISAGFQLETGTVSLGLKGEYVGVQYPHLEDEIDHRLGALATGEWTPTEWLDLSGGIGVRGNSSLEYPFHLAITLHSEENWGIRVKGGQKVEDLFYRDLWKNVGPVLRTSILPEIKTQYLGTGVEIRSMENRLFLSFGIEWWKRTHAPILLSYDSILEGYPLKEEKLTSYKLQAEGAYEIIEGVQAKAQWASILEDRMLREQRHTLDLLLQVKPENRPMGGSVSGSWTTAKGNSLPALGLEGFYRPLENLEIALALEDILSPLMEDGRTSVYPFISPGFRALLKATVTF
jgi:hypothetical protein